MNSTTTQKMSLKNLSVHRAPKTPKPVFKPSGNKKRNLAEILKTSQKIDLRTKSQKKMGEIQFSSP
jgi:hypothetical protein